MDDKYFREEILKKRFSLFLNLFELISGIKKSIFIEADGASMNTNL